jgi:hypothetical protein
MLVDIEALLAGLRPVLAFPCAYNLPAIKIGQFMRNGK